MKAQFKVIILSLAVAGFISGCASSGPTKKTTASKDAKTESVADIGKKELGNDLEARLERSKAYTDRTSIISRMKGDDPDVRCRYSATKEEKDNWQQLLKVAYACSFDKNWATVYKIGQDMSTHHIDSPWGPYFLSLVSEEAGDLPRAIWMAGLASRKAPNNSVIEFQKARLLWKTSQRDAAFHAAKNAYELDNNLVEAAFMMAQVYLSDYQFDKAEEFFAKVVKANRRVFTANIGLAESLAQQGKFDKAIPYFEAALRLKQERTDIALRVADIYDKDLKDPRRALSWYDKVLATFPEHVISKEKQDVQAKYDAIVKRMEEAKNPASKVAQPKQNSKTERAPASEATDTGADAGGAQ